LWPAGLTQVQTESGTFLGPVVERETRPPENAGEPPRERILLKIGNRDVHGLDFRWFDVPDIRERTQPKDAVVVERREHGNFHGYLGAIRDGERIVADGPEAWKALGSGMHTVRADVKAVELVDDQLEELHGPVVRLQKKLEIARRRAPAEVAPLAAAVAAETARIAAPAAALEQQRETLGAALSQRVAVFTTADGREKDIRLDTIVRAYRPNAMHVFAKIRHYTAKLGEFVFSGPRESNTEGGIFPALFGTLFMVLLMTLAVVPMGVIAALYLHEYARQGFILRTVRLAVSNLAGVPSIVFGMFGLAFFVYGVGGFIDRTLFSAALPNPTFGTGGLLWASMTLALLTLPVVIVATEEGLSSVPRANREAALALGATQWQTLRHVVLPNAMPGILTGVILAVSRGAGEVAPLMLTGVVKLAPDLAVDGGFPFVHLERKFMHLGFHIYDVSMQSPNVEAAKPMVYTTTLLLLVLVVALNASAIVLRNRMRRRYRGATL
jgi:phosphate transport system permease protein